MTIEADVAADGIGWDDTFISAATAERMRRELKYALWRGSRVVKPDGEGGHLIAESTKRVSESAAQQWFTAELQSDIVAIEGALCTAFGLDAARLESWQAVRYRTGGKFELHHDGGSFAAEPAGERVLTILIYLQTPASGGETYFPELDLLVTAVAGKLVVWNNLLPDGRPNNRFLHAATPVHAGRKTILTTWSRERVLR